MGVVRDPAKNQPFIKIGRERVALSAYEIKRDQTRAADRAVAALVT